MLYLLGPGVQKSTESGIGKGGRGIGDDTFGRRGIADEDTCEDAYIGMGGGEEGGGGGEMMPERRDGERGDRSDMAA